MAGLTQDQILQLLAAGRQKGVYRERLATFLNGGEAGISVSEVFPDLAGKKTTSLKTGFENVKKSKDAPEGSDNVVIRVVEDKVYLINMALVQQAEAA
jgi:hypothetical protein